MGSSAEDSTAPIRETVVGFENHCCRRGLIPALLFALTVLPACGTLLPQQVAAGDDVGPVTTIIVVRHAEREPGADPPLNDEGLARRDALAAALREAGVTTIYATDLLRNRQTVEPLAAELGLAPILVNPARYVNTTLAADEIVSEILRDHAGETLLFCGNIGSIFDMLGIMEQLYRRLGGTGDPPIRYEDMYIGIVRGDGSASINRAAYGGESSLD
jgi:hypothetical protein